MAFAARAPRRDHPLEVGLAPKQGDPQLPFDHWRQHGGSITRGCRKPKKLQWLHEGLTIEYGAVGGLATGRITEAVSDFGNRGSRQRQPQW